MEKKTDLEKFVKQPQIDHSARLLLTAPYIIPKKAAQRMSIITDMSVKRARSSTRLYMTMAVLSLTALFHNFKTALSMSTHTHARMPANAFFTAGIPQNS
jgi:hypothetical protein